MPGTQQAMNLMCNQRNTTLDEEEQLNELGLCEPCVDEHTWYCESCNDRFTNPDAPMDIRRALPFSAVYPNSPIDTDMYMCMDCASFCSDCGECYSNWDDAAVCCDTYRISDNIHAWDYRPDFRFYKEPDVASRIPEREVLYMGMELEVEKMGSLVDDFLADANEDYWNPKFVYTKSDGSLSEEGVEICSMPASLKAFKEMWPKQAMDKARAGGARSYAYQSCGLHIHVSRTAFTPSHMWKFVRFQIRNPLLCQRIGGRANSSYAEWYDINGSLYNLPKIVKGESSNRSRYVAINFQRRDTVELRYFKGNILPEAVYRNFEFVDSIYEYTKKLSINSIMTNNGFSARMYFAWLIENAETYPNLMYYIGEHNIIKEVI